MYFHCCFTFASVSVAEVVRKSHSNSKKGNWIVKILDFVSMPDIGFKDEVESLDPLRRNGSKRFLWCQRVVWNDTKFSICNRKNWTIRCMNSIQQRHIRITEFVMYDACFGIYAQSDFGRLLVSSWKTGFTTISVTKTGKFGFCYCVHSVQSSNCACSRMSPWLFYAPYHGVSERSKFQWKHSCRSASNVFTVLSAQYERRPSKEWVLTLNSEQYSLNCTLSELIVSCYLQCFCYVESGAHIFWSIKIAIDISSKTQVKYETQIMIKWT